MLGPQVENLIADFLNVKDINEGVQLLKADIEKVFNKPIDMNISGVSHIAMDTRPTSNTIYQLVR